MSPVLCATKWPVFFLNRNGLGIDTSDARQSMKLAAQRRRHAGYSRPHDSQENSRRTREQDRRRHHAHNRKQPGNERTPQGCGVKGSIVKPFKGDAVLETFHKLAN